MSALNNVLKQQNQLLATQVEELATQVDNLKSNFAAALSKLQPHDPDFVAQFVVQQTPAMVPAQAVEAASS